MKLNHLIKTIIDEPHEWNIENDGLWFNPEHLYNNKREKGFIDKAIVEIDKKFNLMFIIKDEQLVIWNFI